MTKFADQLFADLMREHGPALAHTRPSAARPRPAVARRKLLAGRRGRGGRRGGRRRRPGGRRRDSGLRGDHAADGTVTLAVTRLSGIAGANGALHKLGDRVVVVPVEPGCPSLGSLRPPNVPLAGHPYVQTTVGIGGSATGSVTVNAKGIPAGDILVVGVETTTTGTTHVDRGREADLTSGAELHQPARSARSAGSRRVGEGARGQRLRHRTGGRQAAADHP